ncbi:hypothetical protein [Streptomyces sp. NPDC005336]|uniref:hypothetical protein n=1 Tax=unclassified Streptomyces TaxID=2593676 RepID=UPI0033BB6D8D
MAPGAAAKPEPVHCAAQPHPHPGAERALAHLHGLETALSGLVAPLRASAARA